MSGLRRLLSGLVSCLETHDNRGMSVPVVKISPLPYSNIGNFYSLLETSSPIIPGNFCRATAPEASFDPID